MPAASRCMALLRALLGALLLPMPGESARARRRPIVRSAPRGRTWFYLSYIGARAAPGAGERRSARESASAAPLCSRRATTGRAVRGGGRRPAGRRRSWAAGRAAVGCHALAAPGVREGLRARGPRGPAISPRGFRQRVLVKLTFYDSPRSSSFDRLVKLASSLPGAVPAKRSRHLCGSPCDWARRGCEANPAW